MMLNVKNIEADKRHLDFKEAYYRDGYVVVPYILNSKEVDQWLALYSSSINQQTVLSNALSIKGYYEQKPDRFSLPENVDLDSLGYYIIPNPGSVYPQILGGLLRNQGLWLVAAMALDISLDDVAFSLMNFTRKPALYGPRIAYHRDYRNKLMSTEKSEDMVRMIMPLCDSGQENGGIAFVKGSHNIPDVDIEDSVVDQEDCASCSVTPNLRRGDAVLFNSKVIHGGGYNQTSVDRVNLVLQFTPRYAQHLYRDKTEPFCGWSYTDFQ